MQKVLDHEKQNLYRIIDVLVGKLGGDVGISEEEFLVAEVPAQVYHDSNFNFRIVCSKGTYAYVLENRKDLQI